MSKYAVITSNSSISNSNSNSYSNIKYNNRGRTMNTLLLTASNFKEAGLKLLAKFKDKRSVSKTNTMIHFDGTPDVVKLRKLNFRKASFGGVKMIEEFDLAGCFDRSEIIAAKVSKLKLLQPHHDNLIREESWYDRKTKKKRIMKNRQINQRRGN